MRNYDVSAPDVVSITMDRDDFLKDKFTIENITEVFFIKDGDTLEKRRHFKKKVNVKTVNLIFLTTRLIDVEDTVSIKNELIKEKVLIVFKDKRKMKFKYCTRFNNKIN
jgi:hypothetical protein